MSGVSLHVRTCRPRFCISGTARPIGFNFGVWVGGHELGALHKSWVGYLCTCARADRASVFQERLGRLCSNLVRGLGVTKYVLSTSHGWGGASLHVCTCTHRTSRFCNISAHDMSTGGVSYTVGGAAAPPTLRFATPTLCFATPTFVRFSGFLALKR